LAVRQCHIFGHSDGLRTDHRAVRDDLALMQQLGHLPPTPAIALRMTRWRLSGKHSQAARRAVNLAEHAANSCAVAPTPGNDLTTS
jgi:hypothetical protein